MKNFRLICVLFSVVSFGACSGSSDSGATAELDKAVYDAPNLLFADGIEPGDAAQCEAPNGQCWYVDAQAPSGGNGTYSAPYNSFEKVVGYMDAGNDYHSGLIKGGDYLYVRGTFGAEAGQLHLGRGFQGGTPSNPTVIKSWRGFPRAVFDGGHSRSDLIVVRALSDDLSRGVVIRNVEITRAAGRGIYVDENVEHVVIEGVVAHDGLGDGFSGVGGGVLLSMVSASHDFTVRNSLFFNNRVDPKGGENNIGGLSILSEPEAKNGSIVRVYNNTFRDEHIAVRHKHSGRIKMHASGNLISDSDIGFYVRALDNEIDNNQLVRVGTAFMLVAENQKGDAYANIHDNDVLDSLVLLDTGYDSTGFERRVDFTNNFYSSSRSVDGIIQLGRYGSNEFDTDYWNSAGNTFEFDESNSTFLYVEGSAFSAGEAEGVLGDSNLSAEQVQSGAAISQAEYVSEDDYSEVVEEDFPEEFELPADQSPEEQERFRNFFENWRWRHRG
ncbi:MAG: hypothetical protein KDD66_00640 [Bdellovibrionales bacterium]|nr:hypothetical protein [Bdellovibrionales bacterium]